MLCEELETHDSDMWRAQPSPITAPLLNGLPAQRKAVFVIVRLAVLRRQSSSMSRGVRNLTQGRPGRQVLASWPPSFPGSAERPDSATQSSVCHGTLSSTVPPIIGHDQSSDELYPGLPLPPNYPRQVLDQSQAVLNGLPANPGPNQPRPCNQLLAKLEEGT